MEHDPGYKLLFSHPAMVEDLLRGFVHEEWLSQVDFSTLEIEKGDFVSDKLVKRSDDVVWRVKFRDDWLYVYLAIEFQSSVDRFMALRMMVYVGLLYQHLERGGKLTRNGRLPPVLPLVLYNGEVRWAAPLDISELIETAPSRDLMRYRPRFRYLVLDEGRFAEGDLSGMQNLAAALFRLEASRGPDDIRQVLACLIEWLREPEQRTLRRAFAVWMRRVLLPARIPGVELEEFEDIQEVQSMLAERVKKWTEEWKQQGLQQGLEQGLEQGREQGREQGLEQGREQGLRRGLSQGEAQVLRRLLTRRFGPLPDWVETKLTEASTDQLENWADRILDAGSLGDVFGDPA